MDFKPGWERRWIIRNASRLGELRAERRVSQRILADEAKLNASQISRAEKGQDLRLSTLLKILDALGYRFELELQEICEEVGDLFDDESQRRAERREIGLLSGKRWR